jgi:hypothetical protein
MSLVPPGHVRCQAPVMAVSDMADVEVPAQAVEAATSGHVRYLAPGVSGRDTA